MRWLQLFLLAGIVTLASCSEVTNMEPVGEEGLNGEAQEKDYNKQDNQTKEQSSNEKEGMNEKIQEPDVEGLAAAFQNYLMQDTDENKKVINYENKEQLLNAFSGVAASEVVQAYMDDYYEERDDGLYLIAKDSPTWFQENEPYEMKKVDDTHYKVIQEGENQSTGPYRLTLHFEYQNGAWLLTKRNIEKL